MTAHARRAARPLFRIALAALALAGAAAAGAAAAEPVLEITPAQRATLGIEVTAIEAAPRVAQPPLPGRVVLPNEGAAVVTARVAGVAAALAVSVGDAVVAGQLLAQLESPEFVMLQRAFLDARTQRELASSTFERERQLADEGIVPGRRAAESQARLREARALEAERRQALRLAGMDDATLEALTRSRQLQPTLAVRAPSDGFVLEQAARVGERVDAGAPLYRIGRLDALHVEIHVPVDRARQLTAGSPFHLELGADGQASGRVIAVGHDVHALDQGVLVRGALEQGAGVLRPGQFVRVVLPVASAGTGDAGASAFEVPNSAVFRVGPRAFVFREVAAGYEPVAVQVLGGSGQRTTVAGPLSAGDALVTRGTAALKAHWLSLGGAG